MKQDESKVQQSMIRTFRLMYPNHAGRLFAIPNGGRRDAATGARLKAEGVRAGVWDLQFTLPVGPYAGMWIEVKSKTGSLSAEQKAFREEHQATHHFAVVRSVPEFLSAIQDYLSYDLHPLQPA